MKTYWQNYIDGIWVDGGAGRIDVVNPGTGEKLAEHALADAADVDRAVMAAQRVNHSGALSDLRPVERGRMVQAMGRYLLENIDDIAMVLTLEQGKPLWESRIEVLVNELQKAPAVLRLSYVADVEDEALVERRLNALKSRIMDEWRSQDADYELVIEPEIFWRRGGPVDRRKETDR